MRVAHPDTAMFSIRDRADLNLALSQVGRLGLLRDASDVDKTLIKTVISELGTNIVKYAHRGFIRVSRVTHDDYVDVDVWAEDRGPGIANVELALQDRYSTGGSLGLGLPSVQRIADTFSLRTTCNDGTIVHVRKRIRGRKPEARKPASTAAADGARWTAGAGGTPWEIGCFVRSMEGQFVGGDLATFFDTPDGVLVLIADVTGHGPQAHAVAQSIEQAVAARASLEVPALVTELHTLLKGTLGAAVGLLSINARLGVFRYVGVGNTGAARCAGEHWRGISKDGVLGQRLPNLLEQGGTLSPGDVICLWTDGIPEAAGKRYAGNNSYQSPLRLARNLVAERGRLYDDAACAVLKWRA